MFVSGLVSAAAPVIGGIGQSRAFSKGMNAYKYNVNQGTDALKAGMAGSNAAFDPYSQSGTVGLSGAQSDIMNRTQATNPTASNINATSAQAYLDPSMAYQQDQMQKAATASGIAGGAVGGGMLKALSQNAGKFAQTGWNNAFQQMLDANKTNFDQGQQLYTNNNNFQQQQIDNKMNMANMGLQATTTNQGNQLQYNTGINSNFGDIAANEMAGYANKGNIFNNTVSGLGKSLASFL